MPLYEYACRACDQQCELLVRGDEQPICPHCGSIQLTKQLSVVAAHVASGGSTRQAFPDSGCGRPQCGQGGCGGLE